MRKRRKEESVREWATDVSKPLLHAASPESMHTIFCVLEGA